MPYLIVEERGERRQVAFSGPRLSIGRAPDNDIILVDEKSSRHHAQVEVQKRGYIVKDLGSLNGLYLDGMRIKEQMLLIGHTFTIGNARITLEVEQSTAIDTQMNITRADQTGVTEKTSNSRVNSRRPARETVNIHDRAASTDDELLAAEKGDTTRIEMPAEIDADDAANRVIDAFRAFNRVEIAHNLDRFLDAMTGFAAKLVEQTRVVLVLPKDDDYVPVSFANFITNEPKDELPEHFIARCRKTIRAGRATLQESQDGPRRAYVPLTLKDDKFGVLYFEKESKNLEFSSADRAMLLSLAWPISAIAGVSTLVADAKHQREVMQRMEGELARTREELQRRSDLQTAELTLQREELSRINVTPQFKYDYSEITGKSQAMHALFKVLDKVTDLKMPVLIIGEPGTGKELIARALHFNSKRAEKGSFIAENCAALPETLLESELFGHEKGAFTGADKEKAGLFELANHGTVFLDEIGETTPALQAKLLRVLEESEVRRVGGSKTFKLDFRLVAATNRPLEDWVKEGKFRQDLFYRINVITVVMPPLRERRSDIPLLVEHFLRIESENMPEDERMRATGGVLRHMMEYHWPGNVRELENEVKRMVALCDGNRITPDLLSPQIRGSSISTIDTGEDVPLKELVEMIEKRRIEEVLKRTEGNKSKAAEILGLSRLGLRKKIERYGVETN